MADAMYKRACVLVEQNKIDLAKKQLLEVINKYPNTTTANLAQRKLSSIQEEI